MANITSVCVYCGSSNRAPDKYKEAAKELGTTLAENNIRLVYGGGQVGLMGIIANSMLEAGGYVVGFMPQYLSDFEAGHPGITELHIVGDMHERKRKMFESADAFAILPGGFGTLDEIFEILTWRQIGLHNKPIVIIDIDKYWAPLFDTFVKHMIANNFVLSSHLNYYTLVSDVKDVLSTLEVMPPGEGPDLVSKWG